MFIRHWINIALLLALAYGSWLVTNGKAPSYGWQHYLCAASPWALCYGAFKAWHRCFSWRRMLAARKITPDLSRGKSFSSNTRSKTSILELACIALVALSIAAILTQLGFENAALYIGVAIDSYLALSVACRLVS